jgi:hypothetical protein
VAASTSRGTFRKARIALLLGVLAFTAAWGASTEYRRRIRSHWDRPLQVGVVMLAPAGTVDMDAWRRGVSRLSARLGEEMHRHRGGEAVPFEISVVGPVPWTGTLPFSPPTSSPMDRAWHALDVWRTVRGIDSAAGGVAGGFDVRVFVQAAPVQGRDMVFAEGSGALNGEVAFVRGSASGDLVIPLQVVGHELLHMVGATDKYDGNGHAREPDGLADPERLPRYPQDHAEWMAGEVALGPERGRLPETLEELRIGAATAGEIGWIAR